MRILVFSDTHHDISAAVSVIDKIGADMIIHAGDHDTDAERLQKIYEDIPVKYVRGNCDYSSSPLDLNLDVGGKKIFITHGHSYNVKSSYLAIQYKAEEEGADLVIFGHTHIPYCYNSGRRILLNPGSLKSGRTFGITEIENGKISADICNASDWF